MSQSFDPEQKEKLTADLDQAISDLTYGLNQLRSAILSDLHPEQYGSVARAVETASSVGKSMLRLGDRINVMIMQKYMESSPPGEDENPQ